MYGAHSGRTSNATLVVLETLWLTTIDVRFFCLGFGVLDRIDSNNRCSRWPSACGNAIGAVG